MAWKGDWDGAIKEYGEALRINPEYAAAHYGLGVALERKGNREDALKEYRNAFTLDPSDPDARRTTSVWPIS